MKKFKVVYDGEFDKKVNELIEYININYTKNIKLYHIDCFELCDSIILIFKVNINDISNYTSIKIDFSCCERLNLDVKLVIKEKLKEFIFDLLN